MDKRRLLERLRLLCGCGAGLEAIAAPATAIARDLIGADSGSIFWLDAQGTPAGFYHDCAPAELKDLFVTRFDELFSEPGGFNMVTFIEPVGPPIGRFVPFSETPEFLASNVYRYLCKPLGHRYALDIRLEREGRGVGLVVLWNETGKPFTQRDIVAAEPVRELLQEALLSNGERVTWHAQGSRTAHFVTDISGEQLLSISADGEQLLNRCQMLRQNLPVAGRVREAPAFARLLAAMLSQDAPGELRLPAADGRLVARATPSRRLESGEIEMFVALAFEVAADVTAVEHLSAMPLTLLQKQIALFAAQGGMRPQCEERFGVSQEALKKHLRKIYGVAAVANWAGLCALSWN